MPSLAQPQSQIGLELCDLTDLPSCSIVEDLINAENADELLRELAVTSTAHYLFDVF